MASGLAIVVGEPLTDLSALLELKDHFGRAVAGKGVRDFHRAIRRAREYGQNVWGFVNGDSEAIMEAVLPRCYKDRVKFRMRRMPIPINPDCMQVGMRTLLPLGSSSPCRVGSQPCIELHVMVASERLSSFSLLVEM